MFDSLYASQSAATARRFELCADAVRHHATVLAVAAAGCAWDGAGATAFRGRSEDTVARLRRCAARLDEAAAALRRHGVRVQHTMDVQAREQARAAQELLRRGEHLIDRAHDVLHDVGVVR